MIEMREPRTPDAPTRATPGRADLDAAVELTDRGLRLLEAAQRRARAGLRVAGPAGDELRATVAALAAQADDDLHHARVILDRLLRSSGVESLSAPRPVIALPPGD